MASRAPCLGFPAEEPRGALWDSQTLRNIRRSICVTRARWRFGKFLIFTPVITSTEEGVAECFVTGKLRLLLTFLIVLEMACAPWGLTFHLVHSNIVHKLLTHDCINKLIFSKVVDTEPSSLGLCSGMIPFWKPPRVPYPQAGLAAHSGPQSFRDLVLYYNTLH